MEGQIERMNQRTRRVVGEKLTMAAAGVLTARHIELTSSQPSQEPARLCLAYVSVSVKQPFICQIANYLRRTRQLLLRMLCSRLIHFQSVGWDWRSS